MEELNQEEKDIQALLDQNQIDYTWIHHPAVFTMDQYKEIQEQLHCEVVKNLFLANRQQTKFYLLLMKGDKPFKTKEISAQINSARLSFGNEEKMQEYLHVTPGSCSVFGLLYDKENQVTLLIDSDLLEEERLGFHPCHNTSTICIQTKDLQDKILKALHHEPTIVKLIGE